MNNKLLVFSLFAILLHLQTFSQDIEQIGEVSDRYSSYKLSLERNTKYDINFPKEVSSLSIDLPEEAVDSSYIIAGTDTIVLEVDGHIYSETGRLSSSLVIFNSAIDKIQLFSGVINGEIHIHLNHLEMVKENNSSRTATVLDNCGQPEIILPATWREGLNAPTKLPSCTEVEHVIIHHSVTSNSATNYQQVVRDIYVFHTKPVANGGREWDDIGYNFLIAPDGKIFQGRDDQGRCDKDNVIGAHMCAKNSNTMGICLLGTFTSVKPTNEALNALHQLVAWKLNKEGLTAHGSSWHPLNTTNVYLGKIAGHKEGCGANYTSCPGDSVYYHLNAIRDSVNQQMLYCIPTSNDYFENSSITIYPQPASEVVTVDGLSGKSTVLLYSSYGAILKEFVVTEASMNFMIDDLPKGFYFISVSSLDKKLYRKIIKE